MFTRSLMLCAAIVYGATALAQPAPKPKYNVLFIAVDDLRPELGAYGNRLIKTPNIDRLASWGVRFDQAFVQYPLCNPSRASLLNGRYPTQTGVLDNRTWFGAAHPEFVSLPKYFKQQGYASLRTGKIFHGGIDDFDAWTDEKIVASAMQTLRRIFGRAVPDPLNYQLTRWATDPFALGAYSFNALGATPQMRDDLAASVAGKLFFAGEATSRRHFGSAHGAYLSGLRAAREIAGA